MQHPRFGNLLFDTGRKINELDELKIAFEVGGHGTHSTRAQRRANNIRRNELVPVTANGETRTLTGYAITGADASPALGELTEDRDPAGLARVTIGMFIARIVTGRGADLA